jgi:hypothetical protein
LELEDFGGWYDLIATVAQDPTFNYRLAGHVETGPASISDPALGAVVTQGVVRFPGQFRTTLWPTATPFDSAQGGPWALLFLGSLGAEVVKVFPPERSAAKLWSANWLTQRLLQNRASMRVLSGNSTDW